MSNSRQRKCRYCPSVLGTTFALKEHENSHLGSKPLTCDICNQTFGRRSSLWNHKRTHQAQRPYHCYICSKTFKWKNSLAYHMKTHGGGTYKQEEMEAPILSKSGLRKLRKENPTGVEHDGDDEKPRPKKEKRLRSRRSKKKQKDRNDIIDPSTGVMMAENQVDSNEPLNLCVRNFMHFESDEDQHRYETILSQSDPEVPKVSEITSIPANSFFYLEDGEYEIVESDIQISDYIPSTNTDIQYVVIAPDSAVAINGEVLEGNGEYQSLAPVQPFVSWMPMVGEHFSVQSTEPETNQL